MLELMFLLEFTLSDNYELKDKYIKIAKLFNKKANYFTNVLEKIYKSVDPNWNPEYSHFYDWNNVNKDTKGYLDYHDITDEYIVYIKSIVEKEIIYEQTIYKELLVKNYREKYNESIFKEAYKHYIYNALLTVPKEKLVSNELLLKILQVTNYDIENLLYEMSDKIPVLILGIIEQLYFYIVKQTKSYDIDKYTFDSNFSDFLYIDAYDLDYDLEYLLSFITPLENEMKLKILVKLYEFCNNDKHITIDNLHEAICEKRVKVVDTIKDYLGLEEYLFNIYMDDNFEIICDINKQSNSSLNRLIDDKKNYSLKSLLANSDMNNFHKDTKRHLKYYFQLNIITMKNDRVNNEIEKLFMNFHDNTIELSEFGEIDAPFYQEIPDTLKNSISEIAKKHNLDILIQELHATDEGQIWTFYIYQKSGDVIQGPSISDIYGCSFEYSEEENSDEDIFDEDGFLDNDRLDEMMEKCVIEVYNFCQKYNLEITQEEIDNSLPTYW